MIIFNVTVLSKYGSEFDLSQYILMDFELLINNGNSPNSEIH